MKVILAKSANKQLLAQIKNVLIGHWVQTKVNTQERAIFFDQSVSKNTDEARYAILVNQHNEIKIVASLFAQYKLTRGLSQIYHLQIEYRDCTVSEQQFFQSEVSQLLPGYKITGLGVTPTDIFTPHQIYMEMKLQTNLQGNL